MADVFIQNTRTTNERGITLFSKGKWNVKVVLEVFQDVHPFGQGIIHLVQSLRPSPYAKLGDKPR